MASYDLRRILTGWEYEPGQITVRKISGDDGAVKIQMRLDLGILQMESSGRPDGRRPHGEESLLDYHLKRLQLHESRNGTPLGFEITSDDCQALREESSQYYHRYLAEFVLEDFAGVERDTARNLKALDFISKFAVDESDRLSLEQFRPYLIMMNTRAQVHMALRQGRFKTALARVESGLSRIQELFTDYAEEESFEDASEVMILMALRKEIRARMPADPVEKLEAELTKAVDDERYEDAAVLRERIEAMRSKATSGARRKRR